MSRMSLQSIHDAPEARARRIMIYGPPGVGKTTLAADAPNAVVVPLELGVDDIEVRRFPRPETWDELMQVPDVLAAGGHDYRTVIFDTVNAAEALAHARLIGTKWETVEKWEGGYNKWRQGVVDICWRPFLTKLDALRARTGMTIILLGHSTVRSVRDPESEGWDQYQLQVEPLAGNLITAWCDIVSCYRFEDLRIKEGKAKGKHTGRRLLFTEHTATAVAKNRTSLPPVLEVGRDAPWAAIAPYLQPPTLEAMRVELAELVKQLDQETATRALQKATDADRNQLTRILNHARALVAQKGSNKEEEKAA